jgi:Ca2+/Na+ antiporter
MTETVESPVPLKPPLTVRRTLIVVAIALLVAGAVGWLLFGAIYFPSLAHDIAEHYEFAAGFQGLILGALIGTVAGYAVSVVTVAVGLRRRNRAGAFAGIFAAALIVTVVVWAAGLIASFFDPSTHVIWLVAVPLLWAIPATATRVLRLRWFAVVLGAALVLGLLAIGALAIKSQQDQQDIYHAYTGPIYAPSTSPDSPIDGYRLGNVDLPDQYLQRITLSYSRLTGGDIDPSSEESYQIQFSEDTDVLPCVAGDANCPVLGTALGVNVFGSPGGYYVSIDDGVIAIYAAFGPDAALAVLNDLTPSTIDEVSQLNVDPKASYWNY